MRLPTRKGELSRRLKVSDEPVYMTAEGKKKLERQIARNEAELPQAIEDVRRTGEFGDFSENEEYKEAKYRMRRISSTITKLTEKLKMVVVIENDGSGIVQLGSTVVLDSTSGQKTFEMVGPHETDPPKGRISHKSPLGVRIMNRSVGDEIVLPTASGDVTYTIALVK
jgi:transcription elongation GreA/GreB family factor